MQVSGNTVLITGGASGIGLALAERFVNEGSTVIICGRREAKLQEAKEAVPALHTRVCDVSDPEQRIALVDEVTGTFPDLNVLVNNAGMQQRANLLGPAEDWSRFRKEIESNVDAPMHLSMLLAPHLAQKPRAAIINVSSGLAIMPGVWVPVYSATKAALHSFTISLRIQLSSTPIEVIEVFPPAVNTDLGGVGLHTFGAPLNDFADSVFADLGTDKLEIGYGGTEERLKSTREELNEMARQAWERMNSSS
ncbi:SDR family NAD(P)-dependent oxidoreductase [Paenibacillus sp. JX-17]|uniref:SDR family NAD(P)-dependent oxidoreductase n=1 Tax=Paenibacillus lacisoli TaxID=3064525 RepID=A0ABT9CJW5_9BACL|nr:SDR family NAD(P)-dependent oxidoreductase [Paenibacillus sp. JX-17]MDO7907903.1 SDR family NAD(P)-dependent oxidoreductase [Paenibacillus sp. JX-17]